MLRRKIKKYAGLSSLFYTNKLKKRCVITNRKKRFILVNITLLVFVFLGMGYSILGNDLGIFGTLKVNKYVAPTLYNVLKTAAEEGTYAKEYTGEHQDSMAGVGDEKIYHWYAPNSTEGYTLAEGILDKNNVMFAGFCWQMIRTTDTGGVKMIYNGVPSDGKCNNSGNAQLIGSSEFNTNYSSPADVGYMYNVRYSSKHKIFSNENVLSNASLSTSYWYADNANWDSTVNKWKLVDPYQVSSTNDYTNLVGKYTFRKATQTNTNSYVYYIAAVNNASMYYIQLGNETEATHELSYYNYSYTYGESFADNGDGTYTINNPTTIERKNWYKNYNNVGVGKYICKNAVDNTCSELMYSFNTNASGFYYVTISETYKYSKGFTYNDCTYTLNSDSVSFWELANNNKVSLYNHHYTCFNTTGVCSELSYIYYIDSTKMYYINLDSGKNVEDALDEMLYDDNVNTTDSNLKTYIETWYQNNMTSYTSKLENTIFCNNRSIDNLGGWDPNGGNINIVLSFTTYNDGMSNLGCINETDRFSVDNSKAALVYPVGLMTYEEMKLLGHRKTRLIGSSKYYWSLTPIFFDYYSASNYSNEFASSSPNGFAVHGSQGVRPAISLKPGTEYTSGDGSMNNPFVVE